MSDVIKYGPEVLKRLVEKTADPPLAGQKALEELSAILNRARTRSGEVEHGHEIKWLVELPMTDEEYARMCDLTGWSADGQPKPDNTEPMRCSARHYSPDGERTGEELELWAYPARHYSPNGERTGIELEVWAYSRDDALEKLAAKVGGKRRSVGAVVDTEDGYWCV